MRSFTSTSTLTDDGLALGLAPALTPDGLAPHPSFFHGFLTHPQVTARGLVALADVTATRYFNYTPTTQRDPVLTAHGDRLRAECFSACNGVYARLDVAGPGEDGGLDGGEVGHGTTNVDLGPETRRLLAGIGRSELLHVDVGETGLALATPTSDAVERPVEMPDRWVRALGNATEVTHDLPHVFDLDAAGTRAFLGTLPPATGTGRVGWVTPGRGGATLARRRSAGSVYVAGLHRLAALRRVLPHVRGARFYGTTDPESPALVEIALPGARLSLGLTGEAWRGYSGEGALLSGLAGTDALEDADLICALLAFEPDISVDRLGRDSGLEPSRVRSALAVLAVSGRVGWDNHDEAWFHRELPYDPDRVEKDNPRLRSARALLATGAVTRVDDPTFDVRSGDVDYRVRLDLTALPGLASARCTCTWYLSHRGTRGPCKHVLAAYLLIEDLGR